MRYRIVCFIFFIFALLTLPTFGGTGEIKIKKVPAPYADYLKGLAAIEEGDLPSAESYLKNALKISPRSSEIWSGLAEIYLKTNRLEKALAYFRKARSLNHQNKEAYYGLGFIYLRLQKPGMARLQYEALLELFPDEKPVYFLLADLYTSEKMLYPALQIYRKILKFLPDEAVVFYNYSVILVQLKKFDAARENIDKTLELAPDFIPAQVLLARIYQETNDLPNAKKTYQTILEQSPHERIILTELAKLYIDEHNWLESADTLAKMPEPKDAETLRLMGYLYDRAEEYEKALASLEKSLELKDNVDTRFYLAVTLDHLNRDTETITELRKLVSAEPENAVTLNYLGYTLVERNENLDEAEILIKKAVRLDPDNGAYLDSLGWLYFKKGNLPFARYYLLKAIRRDEDPEIYQHLSEIYQRLGRQRKSAYYQNKSSSFKKPLK